MCEQIESVCSAPLVVQNTSVHMCAHVQVSPWEQLSVPMCAHQYNTYKDVNTLYLLVRASLTTAISVISNTKKSDDSLHCASVIPARGRGREGTCPLHVLFGGGLPGSHFKGEGQGGDVPSTRTIWRGAARVTLQGGGAGRGRALYTYYLEGGCQGHTSRGRGREGTCPLHVLFGGGRRQAARVTLQVLNL